MENNTENNIPVSITNSNPDISAHRSIIQTAYRCRWIVLISVIVATIIAFIYVQNATPIYSSNSKLYIEQTGPKIINEYVWINDYNVALITARFCCLTVILVFYINTIMSIWFLAVWCGWPLFSPDLPLHAAVLNCY